MFTTIITFFLTVLGALRATPLYSGILTIGNGLGVRSWFGGAVVRFCLDDEIAPSTERPIGNNLPTVLGLPLVLSLPPPPTVFTLPSPPILLTLPGSSSSRRLVYSELVTLLTVVGVGIVILGGLIWHLRALYLGAIKEDIEGQLTGATLQFATHVPYNGNVFSPVGQLAGVLEPSTMELPSAPSLNEPDSVPSHLPEPTPVPTFASSTVTGSGNDIAADHTLDTDGDGNDGDWKTWTNKRHRRPPTQPPPSAFCASSSRSSSSALSDSLASDSLFLSVHSPTRIRTTPLLPSIISYNKFSVLEVFEVEE